MLLHIDGSKHQWFCDERWYDLIVILDDATSEIYYAQLVEEESTRTVMAGLREVIENKGLFCALYSDRGSHFFVTPKAGEKVDKHRLTQVGRAMKELGVQMIPAYSPQARGGDFSGLVNGAGLLQQLYDYLAPITNTPGQPNSGNHNVGVTLRNGQTVTTAFSPGPAGVNPYNAMVLQGPKNSSRTFRCTRSSGSPSAGSCGSTWMRSTPSTFRG
jgi:hypothetical protein